MNDYMRESLSYFGLYSKMRHVKKKYKPVYIPYGVNSAQYILYYEPEELKSDKIIVWVHGGGWNAGSPKVFDFVGQCVADQGYRFLSLGYRLSPINKYPVQIRDVCRAYNYAINYMKRLNIDVSQVVVAGPSAGAHLTSIMCYCRKVQKKYHVNISNIIGFVGFGGPYSFRDDNSLTLKLLLDQLFKKGYDRRNGEPVKLMAKNHIPMLLIQSKHDGLMEFACAEDFARRAEKVGNPCEIYSVTDKRDTHSWYTAGLFLETRETNKTLDKFFDWVEKL